MNDSVVQAALLGQLGLLTGRGDEIDGSTELIESGILDSFGVLELLAFASEKFNVQFSPEDMVAQNLRTVNSLAEFVRKRI